MESNNANVNQQRISIIGRVVKLQEITVIVPFIILFIVGILVSPNFLNRQNLFMLLRSAAFMGIVGLPMAFLLMTKSMDLSAGSVVAVTGIIFASLVVKSGVPVPFAALITLGIGLLVGTINGVLAMDIGVPSFLVTLGMQFVLQGAAYYICGGISVTGLPDWFVAIGEWRLFNFLTVDMLFFFAEVAIAHFIIKRTVLGQHILLVGTNAAAANLSGIKVIRIRRGAHMVISLSGAVAGILFCARTGQAAPATGSEWDLQLIAAAIIGGTSLYGGKGSVLGAALGTIFMRVMLNVLIMIGLPSDWQYVGMGACIIIAIILDIARTNYLEKKVYI